MPIVVLPNQFGNKFDLALEAGGEFEDFFRGLVANATVECKKDYRAHKTGNLYVEYQCRGKPSGIAVTQADWWAFGVVGKTGDVEVMVVASVPWLRERTTEWRKYRNGVKGGDDGLSLGVLVCIGDTSK